LKLLGKFAKNYLPILFNIYTTKPVGTDEEGQRLAALDTIKVIFEVKCKIGPWVLTSPLNKDVFIYLFIYFQHYKYFLNFAFRYI